MLDVIRSSHGALVPLTRDSAAGGVEPPAAETAAEAAEQAEYGELLTRKMRSQESYELYFGPAVTDLLDKDTLSRWLTNLWPVTCLTCGEPLGSKADLSADPLTGGTVLLSMHHSACRASGDRPADGAVTMHPPSSSFVAGYLTRPGRGPSRTDIPVMVVNPSCEQLLLAPDSGNGWRNVTLDDFTPLGLTPATGSFPPAIPQIRAALHGERLNVTVEADLPIRHEWALDPPPRVVQQVRRCHGFAIALTTKILPALVVPDDLPGVFADPEALTGWIDLGGLRPLLRHRRR
jgi:hypothetical protein